ncbi:hypothetical protein AALN73_20495 [Bacteroides stercorirosoris]|uniref:Uncharacterized protein n=1 Tax=Bacteroides stercorirosoris TaxID=871324 RepID=A0A1M6ADR0_9BACE|nr:hypothetical protein [Bacteroides stercorirosoris]SHI34680.1 hypothetical protein SAMN05444350_101203 [Bacteroides stercorirosoris]
MDEKFQKFKSYISSFFNNGDCAISQCISVVKLLDECVIKGDCGHGYGHKEVRRCILELYNEKKFNCYTTEDDTLVLVLPM